MSDYIIHTFGVGSLVVAGVYFLNLRIVAIFSLPLIPASFYISWCIWG
jgi:hypothetical protein